MAVDVELIYRVRKLITAANLHRVKTWILCYEMAAPDSATQAHYEELLRSLVRLSGVVRAPRQCQINDALNGDTEEHFSQMF